MKELPKHPQFCPIMPVAYLEEYATQSTTHLVLAHIVDKNPEYADFYRRLSDRGDFIICDNGAFELGGSYNPSKLVQLGHRCGADAIVLPDYPGSSSLRTREAAIKFAPQIIDEGFRTVFVPQSKIGDLEDWIYAYEWATNNAGIVDIIGMSILGIPNALPNIPRSYARVVLTQLLIDRKLFNYGMFHHYLGLNAGPNIEVPSLILMNALNSCDSSGPVWSALNGHRYNITGDSCMAINKKFLREVDFDYAWQDKKAIQECVQYNLNLTFDMFKYPAKYL